MTNDLEIELNDEGKLKKIRSKSITREEMTVRCPHCGSEVEATWLEFGDPNVHRVMVICNGCKVKFIAGPLKGKYSEAPYLRVFDERSDENELEAKKQYVELLKKHTEWIPVEGENE